MSNMKQYSDRERTARIIENIDAAERKLRMVKQFINPQNGTVNNTAAVAGLLLGADECLTHVRDDIVKFL